MPSNKSLKNTATVESTLKPHQAPHFHSHIQPSPTVQNSFDESPDYPHSPLLCTRPPRERTSGFNPIRSFPPSTLLRPKTNASHPSIAKKINNQHLPRTPNQNLSTPKSQRAKKPRIPRERNEAKSLRPEHSVRSLGSSRPGSMNRKALNWDLLFLTQSRQNKCTGR